MQALATKRSTSQLTHAAALPVGSVLYCNAGYPETKRPEFYEVVKQTNSGCTIGIVSLETRKTDENHVIPVTSKNDASVHTSTPDMKRVLFTRDGLTPRVKVGERHYAYLWDGMPKLDALPEGATNCKDAANHYHDHYHYEYKRREYYGIDWLNKTVEVFNTRRERRAWVAVDRKNRTYENDPDKAMDAFEKFAREKANPEPIEVEAIVEDVVPETETPALPPTPEDPKPKAETRKINSNIPNVEFYVIDTPKQNVSNPKPQPKPKPKAVRKHFPEELRFNVKTGSLETHTGTWNYERMDHCMAHVPEDSGKRAYYSNYFTEMQCLDGKKRNFSISVYVAEDGKVRFSAAVIIKRTVVDIYRTYYTDSVCQKNGNAYKTGPMIRKLMPMFANEVLTMVDELTR